MVVVNKDEQPTGRELQLVDREIPIIAVGNIAYEALCYSFPDCFITGVPNPTNSFGHFKEVLKKARYVRQRVGQARNTTKKCVRVFPKDLKKR